jgi:hypothetical protein
MSNVPRLIQIKAIVLKPQDNQADAPPGQRNTSASLTLPKNLSML